MLENLQNNDYSFSSLSVINDNLQYIDYVDRTYGYETINVSPDVAYRYQGNLFGLFSELNIKPSLFLYTMYANGYNNPTEYDGKVYTLKKPSRPSIPIS